MVHRLLIFIFLNIVFSSSSFAKDKNKFIIATLNLARIDNSITLEKIAKKIYLETERCPDILIIQEVIVSSSFNSSAELKKLLSCKDFAYWKRSRSWKGNSEGTAIITNHKIHNTNIVNLRRAKGGIFENSYERKTIIVDINPTDKRIRPTRAAGIHLAHHKNFSEDRVVQLEETMDALESSSFIGNYFLGGDFNTGIDEPYYDNEFDEIINGTALNFESPSLAHRRLHTWEKNSEGQSIDHIFNSSNTLKFENEKIIRISNSIPELDHSLVVQYFSF